MYISQCLKIGAGELLSDSGMQTFSESKVGEQGWVNRPLQIASHK
jgi:hypothetical protein